MVMGSIFDTPTDEEDQNPPQPQQPPPQDPLAQQPTQDQIDSLNHAQGVVQQGLQTVTNMFGPQAQQTADQNSINQAQGLVNNAFQGINTVGNAVDQDQASANQRLAQVTGGMGQDPLSRGLSQVGPAMNWAQNNVLNQVPIPGAPVIQGINALSNQLGGPQVLPTPNVGGVMQAANLPAEQLPNIPGFSSQPQIAQQFERGAVGAAPYVLGGPESAVGKGLSILGGGLGSVADQNLGTQLGPLGFGQLLGMGLPGLFDRGPRPETPTAQPEPVQTPNTTMAPASTSTTSSYREPAQTPAFYHETSPENARSILTEGRVSNDLSGRGVYVSDSPDLALGQSGKGAMVVLDPAKTEVQAVRPLGQSPEMAQQLGTNYITNRTTSGAVREVRFSADAIQSDPTVRGMVAYAQRGQVTPLTRGFDFQMNPDGSASWTRKGETTTTAPTSTTTTSGGMSPEEEKAYRAGYDLASVPGSNYGRPQYGWPNVGNGAEDNPLSNAHWAGVAQAQAEKMAAANGAAPAGEPAQPAGNMVFAEGHDGNIHTITGFNGIRDGQQWFQTETGEVPLSLLKNLSSGDLAELGRMRTAAGATNLPNPQPITGQPGSPGAQGFQQSPAGQQFAGQGAAGMNVTQPGVSSSNAAPSTTYGGGAGGITGQAPPAGGQPPSGGGQGGTGKPMPPPPRGVDPNAFQQAVATIRAPLRILLAAPGHFLRVGAGQSATHWGEFSDALGDWGRTLASDAGKKAVQAELHDLPFVGGTLPANVPGDVRAETFRAQAGGNPPLNRAWIDKAMESVPILGPALRRMGEANGQFMSSMRDSVYNSAADKIARTVPDADVKFYKDTYDAISHSSGFSTGLPGLSGQGAGQALGIAPNAIAAKFQTLIDPVIKSGGPVPFVNAGARAENIRSLMGTAGIIGTINALGVAFGGKVSLPFSVAGIPASNITTPFGVESDLFKVITTNPAGTAKTAYSGASGYDTMLRLFANAGMAAFNGDWTGKNSVESHTLAWLRGELGPVPGTALDLLLGENWRGDPYGPRGGAQGMVNFNKDLHQGFANHWAPIAAQNMKAAYDAYGPEGLIRAAPSLGAFEAQTSPINTSSQAFKYATNPDTLTKAFTGQSAPLTTILQGKDWNDLMSTEKSALTKSLSPEQLQQIHEESFRQNPESTKRSDTIQYLTDKKTAIENELLDRYNAGQLDKAHVVDYMKAAQKDYYATKDKLDTNPAYLAEQQKFDKTNQSGAQTALDTFYQIPDKAGREAYLQHVTEADPELGTRLRIATQPQNQSKLELMYANGELR